MIKKSVILMLLSVVIIMLTGCSGGGKTSPGSVPGGSPTPTPIGGISVYGYVLLGDSIQDPVGVKFTFINQNNSYKAYRILQ